MGQPRIKEGMHANGQGVRRQQSHKVKKCTKEAKNVSFKGDSNSQNDILSQIKTLFLI